MASNSANTLPVLLFTPGWTLISFPILAVPCLSIQLSSNYPPTTVSTSNNLNFCLPRRAKHITFSAPLFLASKRVYMTFPRPAFLLGSPSHFLLPLLGSSLINYPFFDSLILPLCLVPLLHTTSTILCHSRKSYFYLLFPGSSHCTLYKQAS